MLATLILTAVISIKSGNVYVWEERCANAEATGMGMERWSVACPPIVR